MMSGTNRFIVTLAACLLPVALIAQAEDPHVTGNVPITFYGKVVDQNSVPVAGAAVKLKVVTSHFETASTDEKEYPLETDGNGSFTLTDAFGVSLFITSIQKPGYDLSKKTPPGFVYALTGSFHPDPANPVVIRMWKIAGKEPLVGSAWHGRIAGDGATERFDLKTGNRSANGELEITCTRNPLNSPPPGNGRFDYKFQITVVGGGIQPTDDEFTYRSPENGYLPSFTFGQTADDPKWDVRIPIPKDYYIKTADGHYGRLHVEWLAAQGSPAHLEWDCSINPSGSRNLER
jgi:hypothetical protein